MESSVRPRSKHQTYGTPGGRSRDETARIREWAKRERLEISDRGRIPFHVIEAYENRGDDE